MIRQPSSWTYDVALSFAGEERELALDLASRLHARGVRVFFDRFEELWGQDLSIKLQDVYGRLSRFCVVLVSANYLRKPWTNHERRILVTRSMQQAEPCLLPIRVDDSELPGLPGVIAYKDVRVDSVGSIVESLLAMLAPAPVASVSAGVAPLELVPSDFLYAVIHRDDPDTARFNLGYHLINTSRESRSLRWLEATITPPGQRSIQFMWGGFVAIGERYMQPAGNVLPYPLPAGESRLLGAQLVGSPIGRELLWREGTHVVEIVGWVDEQPRDAAPDLCTRLSLTVSDADTEMIQQGCELRLGATTLSAFAVAVPLAIAPVTPS